MDHMVPEPRLIYKIRAKKQIYINMYKYQNLI